MTLDTLPDPVPPVAIAELMHDRRKHAKHPMDWAGVMF